MAKLKIRPLGDKVLVKVGDRSNLVGLIERLLVSAVVVFRLLNGKMEHLKALKL